MARRVFVHVGAPKTGSTFVQNVLWRNREALARTGMLLPGSATAQDQAMTDLREVPWRDPAATWTWDRLAGEAREWPGEVIVSNEALGGATPAQAARAVASFAPAEVHVVVAGRDLWRTFPSFWQQSVRSRQSWRFETFVGMVERGEFETFWEMHTPVRMLRKWGDLVPPEQRHLVTVPPAGTAPGVLWRRFAGVFGIADGVCELPPPTANESLGSAQVEVLRRVNQALGDRYPHRAPYQKVVQKHLVNAVLRRQDDQTRFGVGVDRTGWVLDLAEEQIKELDEYACQVAGDLEELRPAGVAPLPTPDELSQEQVLDAAVETIIGLLGHADALSQPQPAALSTRVKNKVKRALRPR
ncbi:hypothetical protein [Actinoplanes sp. RD1]|uniref:hypothetical protein n=1 Tax=Actinoplanes sp. RD1 TaxID=3064538 RepID=UPI002740C084|nr:hypothetical protein [Actinoplanes sp. RD1]